MVRSMKMLAGIAAAGLLTATSALALPLQLMPSSFVTTSVPDNNGDEVVTDWLIDVIEEYNANKPASLPTDGIGEKQDAGANVGGDNKSYELEIDDYLYLVLHWGGNPKNGDITHEVFYLGDAEEGETFTFEAPSGKALSYYRFYAPQDPDGNPTPMPDGGNLALMLGVGVAGLALARRR